MVTDKTLLKEVTKELWQTVKKLRPDLEKEPRLQLVLKALITIGDLPNPVDAAMVVGVCLEKEMENEGEASNGVEEKQSKSKDSSLQEEDLQSSRRIVRRRSAAD